VVTPEESGRGARPDAAQSGGGGQSEGFPDPGEGRLPWEQVPDLNLPGQPRPKLLPERLESDPESVERDLFKLVLTIIELVRQLMEKQALRRVEEGDLTDDQIEGLGVGLMHLEEAMEDLKSRYDLTTADLNIDLGPLGNLLSE
jgi:hypothetical protein